MEHVQEFSSGIAAVVERTASAVLGVAGRRGYPLSGTVWSDDTVVTTHRAVEREEAISVTFAEGESRSATLLGRDPRIDIAVLSVKGGGLAAPRWADGESLRVGELVLMLGRREAVRASLGIVSAVEGEWTTWAGGRLEQSIRTDARPFRGFSGGPLVTVGGAVLGLNTAALTRGGSATIPAAAVRRTVTELHEHGRVRQGYLGVRGSAVRLPDEVREATGLRTGLMLASVDAGSPAADAGLAMGDTLLEVGGQPVRRLEVVVAQLDGSRIGERVAVRFVRGGEIDEVHVVVAELA